MKTKTHYACQNCGHSSAKWLGRCPACNTWNSLVEEFLEDAPRSVASMDSLHLSSEPIKPLSESTEIVKNRLETGLKELDRVLGGGLVRDSFVLLGGDPGIGKSTLLLQMAAGLSKKNDLKIVYLSGEESVDQISGRAKRLGVKNADRVFVSAETTLEAVMAHARESKPDVLLVDSLQTFASTALESAPGSVSQVREVASKLMQLAKSEGICVWLVGHVTKEGTIAGPKVVEHMVDTVLYFEGDGAQDLRLLRAVKNRFGSSNELGVFEMTGEGLLEVANPSSLFLMERDRPVTGTAMASAIEGTRPLLLEVQALVTHSALAMPRRTAVGMDSARLSLIAAILEKHMQLELATRDLFFNVAGGLRISEPAVDLAAAAAIVSSHLNKPTPTETIWIGEIGLTGEVRTVSQIETRLQEAKKLGFKRAIVPKLTKKLVDGIEIQMIRHVSELSALI